MTQKTTKATLFTSAMSLGVCTAMLIGTTFAWFTDSVSSNLNTMKAGNLDIKLEYYTANNGWQEVKKETKLFEEGWKWEPGHTRTVALRITNEGSLDLKYKLGLNVNSTSGTNVYNQELNLADYLKVGFIEKETVTNRVDAMDGNLTTLSENPSYEKELLNEKDSEIIHVTVTMPTDVGNEANAKAGNEPQVEFGLNLLATQATSEKDSFGNDYDDDAVYPVTNVLELKEVLKNGGTAILDKDVKSNGDKYYGDHKAGMIMENGGVIDGNGHTISVTDANTDYGTAIYTEGGTIKNVTINSGFRGIFGWNLKQDLYLDNVTIEGPTYTFNFDGGGNKKIIATNSTFNGWTSYAATLNSASFTDCKFGQGAGNKFMQAWTDTTITRGEFESGYEINMAKGKLTLIDCTLNGVLITPDNVTDLLYNDAQATDGTVAVINN